jgi:LacI family transcriptional regulator
LAVTLREIARQLGLSVTTVSNVLRNKGRFSDDTRRAVLEAVHKAGYKVQPTASAGRFLGLLYCLPPVPGREKTITSSLPRNATYFTTEAVAGIDQLLAADGYHLLFRFVSEDDKGETLPEMVAQRAIQGVFIVGGSVSDEFIHAIHATGLPTVVLFTQLEQVVVDCVLADNKGGAYLAVQHLISLGHRRIGMINGWPATRTSDQKLQGFQQAHAEAGLSCPPELIRTGEFTLESGCEQAKSLLTQAARPTALFVADDTMALGALRAARELGLNVPDDLSLVGFGDSPLAGHVDPPLTTISVDKRAIGELAAQRMLQLLSGASRRALQITVATELVRRQSTAPPAETQAKQEVFSPDGDARNRRPAE